MFRSSFTLRKVFMSTRLADFFSMDTSISFQRLDNSWTEWHSAEHRNVDTEVVLCDLRSRAQIQLRPVLKLGGSPYVSYQAFIRNSQYFSGRKGDAVEEQRVLFQPTSRAVGQLAKIDWFLQRKDGDTDVIVQTIAVESRDGRKVVVISTEFLKDFVWPTDEMFAKELSATSMNPALSAPPIFKRKIERANQPVHA